MTNHIPIEDTDMFKTFEKIAVEIWAMVDKWTPFAKAAMGRQLVSAADGVTANLAEGDGRYGSYDAIQFFVIARGSARETKERLKRACKRGLADARLIDTIDQGLRMMNALISYRRQVAKPSRIREVQAEYSAPEAT